MQIFLLDVSIILYICSFNSPGICEWFEVGIVLYFLLILLLSSQLSSFFILLCHRVSVAEGDLEPLPEPLAATSRC